MQPSGWMSAYSGITVEGESELFFRNIDGVTEGMRVEVPAAVSTIVTRATLLDSARSGSTALTFFDIESTLDGRPLLFAQSVPRFRRRPGLTASRGTRE